MPDALLVVAPGSPPATAPPRWGGVSWGSDGTPHARDAYSRGHEAPADDTTLGGTNDVHVVSGARTSSTTTLRVTRLLNTSDNYDYAIPASGPINIVYAWGVEGNQPGNGK